MLTRKKELLKAMGELVYARDRLAAATPARRKLNAAIEELHKELDAIDAAIAAAGFSSE